MVRFSRWEKVVLVSLLLVGGLMVYQPLSRKKQLGVKRNPISRLESEMVHEPAPDPMLDHASEQLQPPNPSVNGLPSFLDSTRLSHPERAIASDAIDPSAPEDLASLPGDYEGRLESTGPSREATALKASFKTLQTLDGPVVSA